VTKLALLLGLTLLPLTTIGCGGTCGTFCDFRIACIQEDYCNLDDEDAVYDECFDECNQAVDRLSANAKTELDDCVNCVADEIGTPDECNEGDYARATSDDCHSKCNDDGVDEFHRRLDRYFNPQDDC